MDMEQFYTREKANEGIKLPLSAPDGALTEHYLMIRGVDSDLFRAADAESRREAVRIAAMEGEEQKKAAMEDMRLTLLSSLVISWSFEPECSADNVKSFLREAPQIADKVDQIAARRTLFFGKGLSS